MIPEDDRGWRLGRAAALLVLAAVLFLPSVWTRDLWDPDEPGYAEVTRQMELRGDYLVPWFNGAVYSEKPPLFFWASLAAGRIPGVPEGAGGRLVGVLASLGTMLLTWRIGALLMGEATGALAAALLSGCLIFWQLAQSGVIDPLLAFLTTASIYGFALHLRMRPGGMAVFYGAAALGILAKGPVALAVPALAAVCHTLLVGGPRALRARHPLWGIPLAAAPALLWLAGATMEAGPGYARTMLITQNVGRAVDAYVHRQPVWYYALILPFILLPLTPFLPQALVAGWRVRICGVRPMLLPLTWFGSTFLFFSAMSSKKTRYMLVLAPAAALLAAGWIMRRYVAQGGSIREGRAHMIILGGLGLALGAVLALPALAGPGLLPAGLTQPLQDPESAVARQALESALSWPGSLRLLVPAAILILSGALAAGLALRRRAEALTSFLAGWLLFLAVAGALWIPAINPVKSSRPFARLVREERPPGPLFLLDANHPPGLNFYLPADAIPVLQDRTSRLEAAALPEAGFIGNRPDMDRITRRTGIRYVDRRCRRVGEDVLCLARALPPPESPDSADGGGDGDPMEPSAAESTD